MIRQDGNKAGTLRAAAACMGDSRFAQCGCVGAWSLQTIAPSVFGIAEGQQILLFRRAPIATWVTQTPFGCLLLVLKCSCDANLVICATGLSIGAPHG